MWSVLFNLGTTNWMGILLALVPALLNLGLCVYALRVFPRNMVSRIFALFCFALATWQASDAMCRMSLTAVTAMAWSNLLGIGAMLIAPFGLHFTLLYTGRKRWYKSFLFLFLLYFPPLLLKPLLIYSLHEESFMYHSLWGWVNRESDIVYTIYGLWVSGLAFAMLVLLFLHAYKVRNDRKRSTQALLISAGFAIPTVQGTITQVIFPDFLGLDPVPLASAFMSAFSICTIFALSRHRLFSITPEIAANKVLETITDILLICSADGTLKYINPRGARITGIPFSSAEEHRFSEFFPDFHDTFTKRLLGQEYMEGQEAEFTLRGGKKIPVLVSGARVDVEGRDKALLFLVHDITEKKRAGEKLKLTQFSVDKAADAIFWVRPDAHFIYVNEAVVRLVGYPAAELLTMTVNDLDTGPGQRSWPEFWAELRLKGALIFETSVRDRQGKKIPLEIFANYFTYGELEFAVAHARDISERKRAEEAEISKKILETFLANISHEIRTPMNAIMGFVRELEGPWLDEKQKESFAAIRKSGENLLVIINDLLDLSRIQAGKMAFEKKNFSVRAVVNSSVELLRARAQEKKLRIEVQVDDGFPEVCGDDVRLMQVLLNLLGNAIKYTPSGEIKICAAVKERKPGNLLAEFSVSDTGIGIEPSRLKTVFDRFRSFAPGTKMEKNEGAGIGLTIARQLLELQGGTIGVVSTPGRGSTFTFNLPLACAQEKAPPPLAEEKKERTVAGMNLNILLAEDNEVNQQLVGMVLRRFGFGLEVAADGKQAVELARVNHFDCILMDLKMPEMDGYEACRVIRNELKITVPIIALTAHALQGEKNKCLEAGMNDFISKPFDPDTLFDKIMNLVKLPGQSAKEEKQNGSKVKLNGSHGVLNMSYLDELTQGDLAHRQKLVDVFLSTMPGMLDELITHCRGGRFEAVRALAHKMKTGVSMMLDTEAVQLLGVIENCPHGSEGGMERLVQRLAEICGQAFEELKKHD